jgi:hypothetical protein
MTKFVYTPALAAIAKGEIDLATDDIRAALVMTNTTADTDEDAEFVGDVGTLDEYNGAGYARQALTTQVVTANLGADQAEFTADTSTFPTLPAGSRSAQAAILLKHVTNNADSPIIAYNDEGGFPLAGNGQNFVVAWDVAGLIQFKNA